MGQMPLTSYLGGRSNDGEMLLRYDNGHEQHKGHERHTPDGTAEIEFPGMAELIQRFESEIGELPP